MWTVILILGGLALGEGPPGASSQAESPGATGGAVPAAKAAAPRAEQLTRAKIDELLAQLAHPRFGVREQASEQLCTLEADYLPELVQRYRAETRYEPKRRIRYIIEYIFHRDQIIGRNGFIGIEVVPAVLPEVHDPVSGKTTGGVLIRSVKPGFAAQRAGLRDDDIIIAIDEQPVPQEPTTAKFIQTIASHPPGSRVNIRVLRPTSTRKLTVNLTADPMQILEGARLDYMLQDISNRGIWISEVKPGSPAAKAGLKGNEVLRLIDGNRITFGANQIQILLRSKGVGAPVTLEVTGTEAVAVTVRLGSRPPEYITDPKDKREAESRFLEWWQEQGGDLSDRREANRQQPYVMPPPARVVPESAVIP